MIFFFLLVKFLFIKYKNTTSYYWKTKNYYFYHLAPVSLSVLFFNLSISVNSCSVSASMNSLSWSIESHSKLFGVDTRDHGDAVKLDGWLPLLDVCDELLVFIWFSFSTKRIGKTNNIKIIKFIIKLNCFVFYIIIPSCSHSRSIDEAVVDEIHSCFNKYLASRGCSGVFKLELE